MATKRIVRPPRSERASGLPMWLKLIGITLASLVAAHFYLIHQINKVADGIVGAVNLFATASHRGGYYTWDGNLGIHRLHIESSTGGTAALAIEDLELETPGWWWVLQLANPLESRAQRLSRAFNVLGGEGSPASALPTTDELHLHLRGFELDINELLPPGLPDMGFSSGALFETEGCSNVRYFVPLQLQRDLHLPYKQSDLSYGFRVVGPSEVMIEAEFDVPGLMNSRFEVDWQTDQPRRFLESAGTVGKAKAMRWIISDRGFIAARNNWCAEQDKVDADEFQRRHITTVRRILEIYGIRMTPETEAVYSAFARSGGTLTIQSHLPAERPEGLADTRSSEQRWASLDMTIGHDSDRQIPMGIEFVTPRPLPDAFSGSVYDLIAKHADAGRAGSGSPLTAIGDQMRSLTAPAPSPQAEPEPVSAPPKAEPVRPPPPKPIGIALDTASLEATIGQFVAIDTDDGRTRSGVLVAVDPKTLTIQVAVSGGKADLSFTRERIRAVLANPQYRR